MDAISSKTRSISGTSIQKNWWIVDAKNHIAGRLATHVAHYLRGKHKPQYTPHMDCGDSIVVINASEVRLSGRKWRNKSYIRHTGYPGGQRSTPAHLLHEKHPTRVLEYAIKGMLPQKQTRKSSVSQPACLPLRHSPSRSTKPQNISHY